MDFSASARGCARPAHSGGSRHGCPVPRLPVGCQGSREERCCSLPGKHRARWELPAALQGANYGSEAPGCSPAASARVAAGLLRSQPAAGSPAGMWPRPAQLSSAGQMGPAAAGAAFPQQNSLEGILKALGSQGQGEKPNQHQHLLHHFSSFTEPPPSLGGYSVPQHDFPGLYPPEQCILIWQSKHLRLVPF